MLIRFVCPQGHRLQVPAALAGKRGQCPVCGANLLIPVRTPRPSGRRKKNWQLSQPPLDAESLAAQALADDDFMDADEHDDSDEHIPVDAFVEVGAGPPGPTFSGERAMPPPQKPDAPSSPATGRSSFLPPIDWNRPLPHGPSDPPTTPPPGGLVEFPAPPESTTDGVPSPSGSGSSSHFPPAESFTTPPGGPLPRLMPPPSGFVPTVPPPEDPAAAEHPPTAPAGGSAYQPPLTWPGSEGFAPAPAPIPPAGFPPPPAWPHSVPTSETPQPPPTPPVEPAAFPSAEPLAESLPPIPIELVVAQAEDDARSLADKAGRRRMIRVYMLAMGMLLVAGLNLVPAAVHWDLFVAPGWARVAWLMATIQILFLFWMIILPDWSTVWLGSILYGVSAALYALAWTIVAFSAPEVPLLFQLDELDPERAGWWCGMQLLASGLMALICARFSSLWRRAWEIERREARRALRASVV